MILSKPTTLNMMFILLPMNNLEIFESHSHNFKYVMGLFIHHLCVELLSA
jgi:hypothetical protein